MADRPHDNEVASDPAQVAAENRIKREALRHIETRDIDDDDATIEPLASHGVHLPPLDSAFGAGRFDIDDEVLAVDRSSHSN